MMIKIGITGQAGFIGTHLFNFFGLQKDVERISFNDDFFYSKEKLESFVKSCDVIVHLAAMNRHEDAKVIYNTNINLTQKLIDACISTDSKPYILFSSSTQEDLENLYGQSKREGRQLLEAWAIKNNTSFTGLIIPNVFGSFCKPFYNSFIATFCHQLTHDEHPLIVVDSEVNLVFIDELVADFYRLIQDYYYQKRCNTKVEIPVSYSVKVSKVLTILNGFKDNYFDHGIIPDLSDLFEKNLFNTFVSYIDFEKFFPYMLKINTDNRGSFVETIKLNSGGQVSFSTTKPGITRGNHYHTRKAERFAVIKGKALIEFREIGTSKVYQFFLDGTHPSFVDMPVWFTHNITNIGDDELYTIFWINEHYNSEDGDTYFEDVRCSQHEYDKG